MIRPQYHFRRVDGHLYAWDVRKLIAGAEKLPVIRHPLDQIAEIDELYWFESTENKPTCRAVMEHAVLIAAAELTWPIVLCADGRVMDGMHRVLKAVSEGETHILAWRMPVTPPPDFIDIGPDDLPYDP